MAHKLDCGPVSATPLVERTSKQLYASVSAGMKQARLAFAWFSHAKHQSTFA